jgi:spermidine/putrescine-binding protein
MKEMGNKYEIDSDELLSMANENVIDREFSETLKIKLPKSVFRNWKKTKKRFETLLGSKVTNSQLLEWMIVEMNNMSDESYK